MPLVKAWTKQADALTMQAWAGGKRPAMIVDRFELTVILSPECHKDCDNILKSAVDYLRRLGLIKDDSPRYMRRVIIEWGEARYGCRLILRPTV
jgi:Holliday junction resolvase RusA-like endonuclease